MDLRQRLSYAQAVSHIADEPVDRSFRATEPPFRLNNFSFPILQIGRLDLDLTIAAIDSLFARIEIGVSPFQLRSLSIKTIEVRLAVSQTLFVSQKTFCRLLGLLVVALGRDTRLRDPILHLDHPRTRSFKIGRKVTVQLAYRFIVDAAGVVPALDPVRFSDTTDDSRSMIRDHLGSDVL